MHRSGNRWQLTKRLPVIKAGTGTPSPPPCHSHCRLIAYCSLVSRFNGDISRGTAQLNRTKRLTSVDGIKLVNRRILIARDIERWVPSGERRSNRDPPGLVHWNKEHFAGLLRGKLVAVDSRSATAVDRHVQDGVIL